MNVAVALSLAKAEAILQKDRQLKSQCSMVIESGDFVLTNYIRPGQVLNLRSSTNVVQALYFRAPQTSRTCPLRICYLLQIIFLII